MAEKIIFDGNLCKVIEERVLYQCSSDDLLDQYRAKIPIKTKFMPEGTVYYERRENLRSVFVIEFTPRPMRIKWREGENVEIFRISMPFLYWVIGCREDSNNVSYIYPCCSLKRIKDIKGEIFQTPLPNIHDGGNGHMCTGEIKYDVSWPLTQKVDHLIKEIYASTWNQDLSFIMPIGVKGFKDWGEKTLRNGLLWSTLKYHKHQSKNLGKLIELAFGTH